MTERLQGYIRRSGFFQGMILVMILAGGIAGWQWLMRVTLQRIEIRGTYVADAEEVRSLAGLDTGMVLYRLEPAAIASRVEKNSWVERASISRLPTGTLIITVEERTPIARIMDRQGQPSFYLDRFGFQLPEPDSLLFDVVLLSGYPEGFHPGEETGSDLVLSVLKALDSTAELSDAFLSEVIVRDGEIWLRLEPSGVHDATKVRLGRGGFEEKLISLAAFRSQAMLREPDRIFELIDLRFNSQVVARERPRRVSESITEESGEVKYE
jgi:cell division protein FtsQ